MRVIFILLFFISLTARGQFEVLDIPASGTVYIACGEDECMIADWKEFIGLTYNLGVTFDTLQFPSSSYSVSHMQHTKDNTYYLAGMRTDTLQQTVIYKSLNAGQSWAHIFEKPYTTSVFYMRTDSFGFIGTGLGALYRTRDGWGTYDITQYSIGTSLTSAYFLNDSVGLIGGRGSALITNDSGETWLGGKFFNPSTFIRCFSRTDDTTIFATGSPNQQNWAHIYRSNDTGATREIVFESKNEGRRISEIKCFSNGECLAVGWRPTGEGSGLIYRTVDQGDTWYEIPVPTTKMLYNLEFANDSIAFLGGEDGVLIRMNRYQLPPPPQDTTDTTTLISAISNDHVKLNLYPNPSRNSHVVEIKTKPAQHIQISLLDISGRQLRNVYRGDSQEGSSKILIDISDLSGGLYFYKLQIGADEYNLSFLKL